MAEATLAMGVLPPGTILPPGTQVLAAPIMPVPQGGLNQAMMGDEAAMEDDEEWTGDYGVLYTKYIF